MSTTRPCSPGDRGPEPIGASGASEADVPGGGVSREDAYDWVQRNAMQSFHEQRDFQELIAADRDVAAVLSRDDIARAFDLGAQLRNVDAIFERVFKPVPVGARP